MDIVYAMPGHQHRMFINVIHACPNACFFCVDFKGDTFYGFELKNGRAATIDEIVGAVERYPFRTAVREAYYCGIGEPLLAYDRVVASVVRVRDLLAPGAVVAINTSGTFYLRHQRVDFASQFDLIQVSLNAENEDKYGLICRPKVKGAYGALMTFLHDLREYIDRTGASCRVELTVVDPSEAAYLPERERGVTTVPGPDVGACQRIAKGFGWPLKVKKLIRDCERGEWADFAASARISNPVEGSSQRRPTTACS
jgi:TatD family-associated radical SAM protein